ncbi:MAG TPA: serine protease [Xanthomonadaceae bacterium]|nr:serine protease [Xanthomonadaceae bacterium]
MKVAFKDDQIFRVLGSAVIVAPNVAIAARHVLDPEIDGLMDGTCAGYLFGIAAHGLNIWRPHQLIQVPDTDLMIVSMHRASEIPPQRVMPQAEISLRPPEPGEPILIAGFRAAAQVFGLEDIAGRNGIEGNVYLSIGLVTDVFPVRRDRNLNWPCFAVNVDTSGGMSGGPAFNCDGRLIGVLCSSFETQDGGGPSYVSMIHPALTVPFEFPLVRRTGSLLDYEACFEFEI